MKNEFSLNIFRFKTILQEEQLKLRHGDSLSHWHYNPTSMGGMYAQQMFGIHDTLVNCEDTFLQHYHHVIHFDGEHRLDDTTINEVLIPSIRQVAKATK